jgi:hypothetical protein
VSDLLSRPRLGRLRSALAVAVAVAVVAAGVAAVAGVSPATAASSRPCSPPRYPGLGYFTSLTVSGGATCAGGGKVAVAYYHCRLRGGGAAGRCHGKVDGYACSERRNAIPTEIDARVTCRKGRLTVVHTYQQMT